MHLAWNRDPHTTVIVCTGYSYTGSCGTIAPNAYGNFTSTYENNVESVYWADSATGRMYLHSLTRLIYVWRPAWANVNFAIRPSPMGA